MGEGKGPHSPSGVFSTINNSLNEESRPREMVNGWIHWNSVNHAVFCLILFLITSFASIGAEYLFQRYYMEGNSMMEKENTIKTKRIQDCVCGIIGAALLDQPLPSVRDEDWPAIYHEFISQRIIANPANLLDKFSIPDECRKMWDSSIRNMELFTLKLLVNQSILVRLLDNHSIPYAILKGSSSAIYYPEPVHRSMGDVDLIVRPGDFERVEQLMLSAGFVKTNDNYRHANFVYNHISFELHRVFSHELGGNFLDRLVFNQLEYTRKVSVCGFSFSMLSSVANGIVMIEHISHHLQGGVGLRHMIDWFMYVKKELTDEKWPAFRSISDQLGLTTLSKTITRLGQLYFGLDSSILWCQDVDMDVCAQLVDFIFLRGNFGRKDIDAASGANVFIRLRRMGISALQESGKHNWQYLKKHPRLEKFAWVYQLFRYARKCPKDIRKLWDIKKQSKRLDSLMNKLMDEKQK